MTTDSAPKKRFPAKAVADVSEGTIIATIDIEAPAERVFEALTTSADVVKWWGSPETYQTTEWTADVRVGGRWRGAGRGNDGHTFAVEGEFLEIDAPRKLVQTWKAPWDGNNVTTITYRLESIGTTTRLTLRHEGFNDRVESCRGHAEGWERVLGWLDGYVSPRPAALQHYLCRLISPRADFAQTMTPAEQSMMKEHAVYWSGHLASGAVLVLGPVADPKGYWGLAVLAVRDEAHLQALQGDDPVIKSDRGFFYEALPMPRVLRAS